MCGIAGAVGAGLAPEAAARLSVALAHRGPDAEGIWRQGTATLCHRRLSIIDVSAAANQPFEKDGLVIVFNGEIYNYQALRAELAGQGVAFRTESDTEVLLEAWRAWGVDGVRRLRGMFAFAIVEVTTGRAWLARDRFGIKPLFYTARPDGAVAFASELGALEAAFPGAFTLDTATVGASLLYVFVPEDRCIWREVRKLPPGGVLAIEPDGRHSLDRYWRASELLVPPAEQLGTARGARDALAAALAGSVEAHLVSDVPVGAFLSGGIDSSLIVAMAARHLGAMDCYTIRFSDEARGHERMPDDAAYAQRVANHLGVRLTPIDLQADVAGLIPKMVAHLGEPIGDSAAINTFLMAEAARSAGTKVLLSGMGADEVLGGYRRHRAALLARHYRRVPGAARRGVGKLVDLMPASTRSRGFVASRWAKRFLQFAELPEADAYMRSYTYFGPAEFAELLGPAAPELYETLRGDHAALYAAGGTDPLERMAFTDVNHFLVALNQTYTDRASMAASTEVRVPFVDPEVIATAFRIPSRFKIRGGRMKSVLKDVAADWLPDEIVDRPKSSFTMPLRAWVKNELAEMVDDYVLSAQGLAGRGMFDAGVLTRLVADDRSGRADNAQRIWHLLTMEQWFRNHRV
ncbi:asparagine synthase (glutamine-hydrolyzing) [Sphingoaurantiacus capsulatus]|uniref:asparagine synthase (glutamine-hydrolyzing) n=1 Tax=Sphingoaurantiacus capsulatus TaxID=1771310 RepID=A0ABV7XCW9_9SPHN